MCVECRRSHGPRPSLPLERRVEGESTRTGSLRTPVLLTDCTSRVVSDWKMTHGLNLAESGEELFHLLNTKERSDESDDHAIE
jgi:hypothetical protein